MPTCPTPGKASFTTRRAAHLRLDEITRNPRTETVPTSAYACECGRWHLTSHPVDVLGVSDEQRRKASGADRRHYTRLEKSKTRYDMELTRSRRKRNLDRVTAALARGKTSLRG